MHHSHAVLCHLENVPNGRRKAFINQQVIFVGRVFHIAVWSFCANEFTLLLPCNQRGLDFLWNVLRIHIVEQIFERRDVHCRAFCRVYAVRNGYVTNVVFGEVNLRVAACFKVISPKSGQVFCDNAVNFPVLNVREHTLKTRSVAVRSAPAVINVDFADCKAVFTAVTCEHFFLGLNWRAFAVRSVVFG